MKNQIEKFQEECKAEIVQQKNDAKFLKANKNWLNISAQHKYSYHFTWMGRPIIQYPQDIIAMQELIWQVQPDLIIETGIAHGGSLIFYASMLELLGNCGQVVGIDVDIRQHNRIEIEKHPMYKRIEMIEGSSIDEQIVDKVKVLAANKNKVMVVLDSCHSHEHVLAELNLYSPLVNKESYLVVFDTIVEDLSETDFSDRPWGHGDNPKTAVREFLQQNNRFVIDDEIENKLMITVAPGGYLKCIKA